MPVVVGDTQADGGFAHLHSPVQSLRILGRAVCMHILKSSGLF